MSVYLSVCVCVCVCECVSVCECMAVIVPCYHYYTAEGGISIIKRGVDVLVEACEFNSSGGGGGSGNVL